MKCNNKATCPEVASGKCDGNLALSHQSCDEFVPLETPDSIIRTVTRECVDPRDGLASDSIATGAIEVPESWIGKRVLIHYLG